MATSLSASAASTTYLSTTVSEPANDIAVADDGSMAVSQHDAQTVVLLSAVGVARSVDIGCKTSAVEIAPDGSTVWAVCQNSPALAVIDVATGQVSMAGMNLTAANDVVYVPALKRLYIADLDGMIVVVSVQNSADYAVLQRVSTPSFRPSWIAPTSAGTTAYVTTDDGRLIAVDMTTSSVTNLSPTGQYLMSLALGLDETHLYAGAVASGGTSAILELNPLNGQILQATALTYTFPGSSTISVAVGYQSMSVATGLGIVIDGEESGMFDIALDAKGAMGAISNAVPGGGYGSGVDRSASGQRAAFAGTAGQVIGLTISDVPYPPSIAIQAKCKTKNLIVNGETTGIAAGSAVRVKYKKYGKKNLRHVPVPINHIAYVDGTGAFRWKAKVKGTRFTISAISGTTTSNVVTCRR